MKRVLLLVLALAISVGVLWLARAPLAAGRLRAKLEDLGFECGDLDVEVATNGSRARVAPFECTSEERRVQAFTVDEAIEVELEWLLPRRVEVPSAKIEVRRENVSVDTDGEHFLGRSNVRGPIIRLLRLFDVERVMHFDRVHIDALEVTLSEVENLLVHVENISVEPVASQGGDANEDEPGVQVIIESAGIPAGRRGAITFAEIACRVSPNAANVEGNIGGSANIASLELGRSWRFRASVDELNGERPRLSFERL